MCTVCGRFGTDLGLCKRFGADLDSVLLFYVQWESGTDLGLLLVNHLKERHSPITEDTLGKGISHSG